MFQHISYDDRNLAQCHPHSSRQPAGDITQLGHVVERPLDVCLVND